MTTGEFCKLLKKNFGVAAKYCCDLIQRMKIELDMYCPDRQNQYFVRGLDCSSTLTIRFTSSLSGYL
ncbi:Hypothetical protein Mbur_0521 [Methanococcoides burtonii DSM 6242]|uniref:Uncharacterized protein n=1 Tax=Methanococcoides burtonii (strain DSM 6242 / NBRC 107633 / OCM 468 / ACE-M) TaxID=259564 RepID=Q12YH3_METBU|nr:Hypothetical protein Mbur_0521 [Methanococcoides burtonii DSM 6242]